MSKPTHAHITVTFNRNDAAGYKQQQMQQKEYYMGAKLIEIGVNPKDAVYRWSVKTTDTEETWTYSAYWGQSKTDFLSGNAPLTGVELIDCARANSAQGLEVATKLCGYQEDTEAFKVALKQALEEAGLTFNALQKLIDHPGITVAPDSPTSL